MIADGQSFRSESLTEDLAMRPPRPPDQQMRYNEQSVSICISVE